MVESVGLEVVRTAAVPTPTAPTRDVKQTVNAWTLLRRVLAIRLTCIGRSADRCRGGEGLTKSRSRRTRIAFFGHFDGSNFGNEATLHAILSQLQRWHPDAEVTCICTGPYATRASYHVEAIPLNKQTFASSWAPQNRMLRPLRKALRLFVNEPVQWAYAFTHIRRMDMLIVPGTGVLNDAYGLDSWGPHTLFRWALLAKLCRCKLLVVSVGAGPLYGRRGRWFAKSILSLADFRSYREKSTSDYLASIGVTATADPVYPDLAYSLPQEILPRPGISNSSRSVVGLGVMEYAGRYSVRAPTDATYLWYLDQFSAFAEWLLKHGYNVRLLSGDLCDGHTRDDLKCLLRNRVSRSEFERITDEPVNSVDDLLSHIAATDIVVATRFHNILLALLCDKPVIAISFHHKCRSLMTAVGLGRYCLDIDDFSAALLIERLAELQKSAESVVAQSREKTKQFREALDKQYQIIFGDMWPVD